RPPPRPWLRRSRRRWARARAGADRRAGKARRRAAPPHPRPRRSARHRSAAGVVVARPPGDARVSPMAAVGTRRRRPRLPGRRDLLRGERVSDAAHPARRTRARPGRALVPAAPSAAHLPDLLPAAGGDAGGRPTPRDRLVRAVPVQPAVDPRSDAELAPAA